MNSPERVLITGASGWTGLHLSSLAISHGTTVLGIIRNGTALAGLETRKLDLTHKEAVDAMVAEFRPDRVFHLASLLPKAGENPPAEEFIGTNVTGTYHLLDAIRNSCPKARVLIAGSSSIYGRSGAGHEPITEDAAFHPLSLYATTKVAQEMLASQFFTESGLRTVRGRTFNQVGPGEDIDRVCGYLAWQVARIEAGSQDLVLRVANLEPRRDFTDIRDVVAGYWAALEQGEPGLAYNICSGRSESVQRIVEVLLGCSRVNGIHVEETGPATGPKDVVDQIGAPDLLNSCSGWQPTVSLEQSLSDLLDDWRVRITS